MLSIEMADPLCEPPPDGWDRFAHATGLPSLWRADLLTPLAWTTQAPTLLALVRDASGACVAAFHTRYLGLADPRRFVVPGAMPPAGLVECRLHPGGSLAGHWFAPGLSPADRAAAADAHARALRGRLGEGCLGIAYRQVGADDVAVLRPKRAWRLHPEMVLTNRWADTASYLAELPSRHRVQVRRNRRRMGAELRVAYAPTVPPAEASRLVLDVRTRNRPALAVTPPVPAEYFARLNSVDQVCFLTYRDTAGVLLAFCVVHDDGTDLLATLWGGRAPADGGRPGLYFDLYPRLIEHLIGLGRRRLRLGKGQTEVKARFGARPSDRFLVLAAARRR